MVAMELWASFIQDEACILVSIDKDLDTVPGWHYNYDKKITYFVTPEEASYNFYYQLLVGDSSDNIKGAVGVGPAKAKKILSECKTELEMYQACIH